MEALLEQLIDAEEDGGRGEHHGGFWAQALEERAGTLLGQDAAHRLLHAQVGIACLEPRLDNCATRRIRYQRLQPTEDPLFATRLERTILRNSCHSGHLNSSSENVCQFRKPDYMRS